MNEADSFIEGKMWSVDGGSGEAPMGSAWWKRTERELDWDASSKLVRRARPLFERTVEGDKREAEGEGSVLGVPPSRTGGTADGEETLRGVPPVRGPR